ncbi:MAG: lasso peptide biosynthesis protein [Pirellulales bacterium]|nr:lasso peptide biosynthesis protein [Pirellulales bacterium]
MKRNVPGRRPDDAQPARDQRTITVMGIVLPILMMAGCSPVLSDTPAPRDTTTDATPSRDVSPIEVARPSRQRLAPTKFTPPVGCPFKEKRDVWEVCTMQGKRIGYAHTRIDRVTKDNRTFVRLQRYSHIKVMRSSQTTELRSKLISLETLEGRLVSFTEVQQLGPTPTRVQGHVDNDQLVVERTSGGPTRTATLPWSNSDGGYQAIEYSLAGKPMKPGESRNLRVLVPNLNETVTVRLVARHVEPTQLLHGSHQLLRIDNRTWFADGQAIDGTIWVDKKGEILKTDASMQQQTFRCSREEALDETDLGKFDIGLSSLLAIDRPIPNPHDTRRIRYRVSLADGDPAAAFVAGTSQRIKSLGTKSAELTVLAIRPDQPKEIQLAEADRPTIDDINPNSLVQSDDPRVRTLAEKATQGKTDAWSQAVALERYVHDAVRNKTFSHALASAAEVAETGEGDCTEHAVLLAAMARAVGLPARVAIGLVYLEQPQEPRHAFGYHMWTEIYVRDRWIPMDATLGRGGIGAAHLRLAHSNLKDANAMSSFLPVVNVMGRLKIKVLEIK